MTFKKIAIDKLNVNQGNDRHGELENETAAIAWLFANHNSKMKRLARDIAVSGGIYEPPLIFPNDDRFVVYDGNRRTTCLKLIVNPKRAPSTELQRFFKGLHDAWHGTLPSKVMCRLETDRDKIDEILYRRHTGSQGGVGQAKWDGRMKATFVNRTGKGGGVNIADEIEERLREANLLPGRKKIPRTNLSRLLSAEAFRNRVGISCNNGKFQFIRKEDAALEALARIAKDLAEKTITLDDVWDVERKSAYLDQLESEGVLPTVADAIKAIGKENKDKSKKLTKPKARKPERRNHLIPQEDYGVAWAGRLQRQRAIWEELQFSLELDHHPNAIAVLCRVLLELSVDNYLKRAKLKSVSEKDALLKKLIASAEDLNTRSKIDKRYLEVIRKARTIDAIISVDTLNKYVHSSHLAASPDHLTAIWDTFADLIVQCLNE